MASISKVDKKRFWIIPVNLPAQMKSCLKLIGWQVVWPVIHVVLQLEKKNQLLNYKSK